MESFLTPVMLRTALEVGLIYAIVALSLFISFSILNICDLSTDGCFTLGCAVGAVVTMAGHPLLAIPAAMLAGVLSGAVTALLQTKLGVPSILAGIIVNTGLYTVNLGVMGFSSNVSIFGTDTLFSLWGKLFDGTVLGDWSRSILLLILVALICAALNWFLKTRIGLSIRATGDSMEMVRASSIDPSFMIVVGLCCSNALTGLAGSLFANYNKSADINLGTGMVTIALAALIIGETLFGKRRMPVRIVGVVIGSCLYRFMISIALRLNAPTEAFKLVSALIVAIAIAAPEAQRALALHRRKKAAMRRRRERGGKAC